jgi:hypothetical protein
MTNANNNSVGKPKGKDNCGDIGADGRIIKFILKKEGMGCNHVTQDMGQWRAILNAVMDFRVP